MCSNKAQMTYQMSFEHQTFPPLVKVTENSF